MLLSLLTILFVGLKLTGFIDWSWWLVVSPTLFHVFVVVGTIAVVAAMGVRRMK